MIIFSSFTPSVRRSSNYPKTLAATILHLCAAYASSCTISFNNILCVLFYCSRLNCLNNFFQQVPTNPVSKSDLHLSPSSCQPCRTCCQVIGQVGALGSTKALSSRTLNALQCCQVGQVNSYRAQSHFFYSTGNISVHFATCIDLVLQSNGELNMDFKKQYH